MMADKNILPENENNQTNDIQQEQLQSEVSSEQTTPSQNDINTTNNKKSQKMNKSKSSEQKNKSDNTLDDVKKTEKIDEKPKDKKHKSPVSKLSVIAILLTVGLGGGMYFHGHQQANQQKATITQLHDELSALKQELSQVKSNHQSQQNKQITELQQKVEAQLATQQQTQKTSQQQFIDQVQDALKVTDNSLQSLHEQLASMSTTDNNIWLISQANYLVNLAGRKIWSEQDFVTARLLLKSADSTLAETNDPSLLPARQAINRDIAALSQISYIDFDGIVMNLMQLADQVVELPLVDHYQDVDLALTKYDDSFTEQANADNNIDADNSLVSADTDTQSISSSIADWSTNLWKSTRSFVNNFVVIEKYDSFGECIANAGQDVTLLNNCKVHKALITPEQSLYLRENIRLQLFIAAQAVPRHQDEIYQRTLIDISTWIYAYFNTNSPSVDAFLNDLDKLQQQSISSQNQPEKLESATVLDRVMQTRVRSLLTAK